MNRWSRAARIVRNAAPLLLLPVLLAGPLPAQELSPDREREAGALVAKGIETFERQEWEEAIRLFLEARELNPFDYRPAFYLAQCEFNLWKTDLVEARARRIEEYIQEARRINDRFGGSHYLLGIFAVHNREYRVAVDAFRASLERGFQVRLARANLAQCLFLWGVAMAGDGRSPDELVIQVFEDARISLEALKDDLRYPQAEREQFRFLWISSMVNLVAMHQKVGNPPLALELIDTLMRVEPKNPLHRYNLGLLRGAREEFEQAMAAYREALALNTDPEWVDPHLRIACIHSLEGNYDLAEEHFALFFAKQSDHTEAWFRYAEHFVRKNEQEKAAAAFRRCIELDPRDLQGLYELGRRLILLRRTAEADKWMGLYAALEALKKEHDVAEGARTGRTPEDGAHVPSEFGREKPYTPADPPKPK